MEGIRFINDMGENHDRFSFEFYYHKFDHCFTNNKFVTTFRVERCFLVPRYWKFYSED